jgi:hypothetical protein
VQLPKEAIVKKLVALAAGLLVVAGVIGAILAGRGSDTASSPGSQPIQAQTNPNPVLNPAGSSPARLAGDGRYFGYISVASDSPPSIGFDVAQFFHGKSVQKAAEEDGIVNPGEPVSNDHYERNQVKEVRSLELALDARVTAGPPASFLLRYSPAKTRRECSSQPAVASCPISRSAFFAATRHIEDYTGAELPGIPVWVTIREGVVVRIDEQYFP